LTPSEFEDTLADLRNKGYVVDEQGGLRPAEGVERVPHPGRVD
jgi:hypothetical protein